MNALKLTSIFLLILLITSCGSKDNKPLRSFKDKSAEAAPVNIPLDKGFSEYISGYTSGVIPANSAIEVRFTPEFAAKINKSASWLFVF